MTVSPRAAKRGLGALAVVLAGAPAAADVHRVPIDFVFIGNAIEVSAPGDTVQLVGNGGSTYHENIVIDRDLTIQGGWRADFQVRDPGIYVSVIRDTSVAADDRRPVIRIEGARQVWLDGVTILGGQFGVMAEDGANLEIRDCTIRGQRNGIADGPNGAKEGGGLRLVGGSLVMEESTIRDCRTAFPGAAAAFVGMTSAVLRDCVVTDASAFPFAFGLTGQVPGGGIYVVDTGNLRLARCEISQCNAFEEGGLTYVARSRATIVDCSFSGSAQSSRGGAMYLLECPDVEIGGLNDVTSIEFATAGNGGGIYADHVASLRLNGCRITNNGAANDGEGGGLFLDHTSFSIDATEFTSNGFNFSGIPPAAGGSVSALSSYGQVTRSTFRNETVASRGAAWFQVGGRVDFLACTFEGNHSRVFGGGLHLELGGSISLDQCLLVDNSAKFGAGASASFTGALSLNHCTVTGNKATNAGAALYIDTSASARVTDSILCCAPRGSLVHCSQSAIDVRTSNVWNDDAENLRAEFEATCGDPTGSGGNIGADPSFCLPAGPAYLLSSSSPCVGTASDGGNMGWALAGCSGAPPTLSIRQGSWGQIKARYRDGGR